MDEMDEIRKDVLDSGRAQDITLRGKWGNTEPDN